MVGILNHDFKGIRTFAKVSPRTAENIAVEMPGSS